MNNKIGMLQRSYENATLQLSMANKNIDIIKNEYIQLENAYVANKDKLERYQKGEMRKSAMADMNIRKSIDDKRGSNMVASSSNKKSISSSGSGGITSKKVSIKENGGISNFSSSSKVKRSSSVQNKNVKEDTNAENGYTSLDYTNINKSDINQLSQSFSVDILKKTNSKLFKIRQPM
jgi:hypothetical protein